jgi:hypothetical protein
LNSPTVIHTASLPIGSMGGGREEQQHNGQHGLEPYAYFRVQRHARLLATRVRQ